MNDALMMHSQSPNYIHISDSARRVVLYLSENNKLKAHNELRVLSRYITTEDKLYVLLNR
jgi:hypothetical protein